MTLLKAKVNMTGGHLFKNMMLFAVPLMISNLLQRLFNTADTMVIGRFSGADGLAAVGGCGPILGLFVWGLSGLAIGADVAVSKMIGMGNREGTVKSVHTAYGLSLIIGVFATIIGEAFTVPLLNIMSVPDEIMPLSVLYLRIYFLGLFFTIVYNFGAAIMRSNGDSTRPTLYLSGAGLMNVLLNLLFVCVFKWDVAGVAIATVVSQIFAAVMVTISLVREQSDIHLSLKNLKLDKMLTKQIISVGLPSSIQSMLFSVSNIVVQSSVNSFGTLTIAANSAACNIEEYVYVVTSAVSQTCISFTGQNNGARNFKNIKKTLLLSAMMTTVMGFAVGFAGYMFGRPLMRLFTTDEQVVTLGLVRLNFVGVLLFINGLTDLIASSMRGMGYSIGPMIISLAGICGFRLIYIYTVFPKFHTLQSLFLCYPISWTLAGTMQLILWIIVFNRFKRKNA